MIKMKLFVLNIISWNNLTVCKQMSSGLFKLIYVAIYLHNYFICEVL